jgi:hypothetical protein
MRVVGLPIAGTTAEWLAASIDWNHVDFRTRWLVRWRAQWADLQLRLVSHDEDEAQSELPSPLVIAGPWRSGTTAMHNLLQGAFAAVTPCTWQCMNPIAFRWMSPPATDREVSRPMDGMRISLLSPQEDEFALMGLGVPSAYWAFLMPSRLDELHTMLDPLYWQRHDRWVKPWLNFLFAVWKAAGTTNAPLLLKSPNHTFRIPALSNLFPDLRVVWMARPSGEVRASNIKMWTAMAAEHSLQERCQLRGLEAFVDAALARSRDVLRWCSEALPRDRFIIVDQRDLLEFPQETLDRVCDRLQMKPEGHLAVPAQRDRPECVRSPWAFVSAQSADPELDALQEALMLEFG